MPDACARCYSYRGVEIICPDCTMERLATQHPEPEVRERLYAAFERHAARLLGHELDEYVRAHARGRRAERIWSG
jgi:hypothetical protein